MSTKPTGTGKCAAASGGAGTKAADGESCTTCSGCTSDNCDTGTGKCDAVLVVVQVRKLRMVKAVPQIVIVPQTIAMLHNPHAIKSPYLPHGIMKANIVRRVQPTKPRVRVVQQLLLELVFPTKITLF